MLRAVVMLLMLAMVATGLMPGEGDAHRNAKPQRTIIIFDYTNAAWEGVVTQTVTDFNAVMPRRGPRVMYRRAEGPCFDDHQRRNVYAVCSVPDLDGGHPGIFYPFTHRIDLTDHAAQQSWSAKTNLMCHELMHALTRVSDNYDALPDTSCVWGRLPGPGSFDIDLLNERFGRKRR